MKKTKNKFGKKNIIMIIAGTLALILGIYIALKMIVFMPSVKGENSIAELETIEIADCAQTLLIRGVDINNPILLYLHSGPGTTEMTAFRAYHAELEKHFTVVLWEQRGTGKSYSSQLSADTMTIEQMVSDAGEVMQYLLTKFDKEKLFIAGHSWGSLLGILTVQRYPQFIYAYAGSGQEVYPFAGEKLSYEYTLKKAQEHNNTQAIDELNMGASAEYLTIEGNSNWYNELIAERKWLVKFGGEVYKKDGYNSIYVFPGLLPSEYTLADFIRFGKGSRFSIEALWPQIMQQNLMESADTLYVPVFFFQGRYDYNTPSTLVSEYYDLLNAPYKELIWFENSGHHPMYEEPELYESLLIEKLLPLADDENR
ncbi:MAG: alpha/beta hydrolase [Clostridia bacterium]|nr:alpha/beta hydrolase [Clostridia bacterium]